MTRLAVFLATVAYCGYFPIAPGTAGSAAGLVVYLLVWWSRSPIVEVGLIAVTFAAGTWAAMNVVVNILLAKGYQPGKQFSLTTMSLDIFFATGMVYLSDGFSSPFFLALFRLIDVIAHKVVAAQFDTVKVNGDFKLGMEEA